MKMEIWTAQRSTPSWPWPLQVELSSFSPLFTIMCVQEWLEATGHKKEIVDLEVVKHKKQWNFLNSIALLSRTDCGPQVLASPYLLSLANKTQTYQTENILQSAMTTGHSCMLCICLTNTTQTRKQHINNQHVNNTQQPMWTTHNM